MLSRFAARLTYANVVSTLALFMVLGGGAYAAATLPNNSVGTEQIVKDGVLKPDIGEDAVGTTEIKPEGVRSGDVKDFSLRCEDFRPAEEACGVPGPEGPAGPVGPPGPAGTGGGEGLTTTTVRSTEEVIELTCGPPQNGASGFAAQCNGAEQVTASCEAGEVATGGSVSSNQTESGPTPQGTYFVSTSARDDRPDPSEGTPTGWTADVTSGGTTSSFSSDPPSDPPDQSVTVWVVCAS